MLKYSAFGIVMTLSIVILLGYIEYENPELRQQAPIDLNDHIEPNTSTPECGGLMGVTSNQGNFYNISKINGECWFAESLVESPNSPEIWYGWKKGNFEPNNRGDVNLYSWDSVMDGNPTPRGQGLCPDGWAIPTISDYTKAISPISTRDHERLYISDLSKEFFKSSGVFISWKKTEQEKEPVFLESDTSIYWTSSKKPIFPGSASSYPIAIKFLPKQEATFVGDFEVSMAPAGVFYQALCIKV